MRAVIKISRQKQWRQDTDQTEVRRRLLPLNPGELREVVSRADGRRSHSGSVRRRRLAAGSGRSRSGVAVDSPEEHERKLAEAARERKAAREAEKAVESPRRKRPPIHKGWRPGFVYMRRAWMALSSIHVPLPEALVKSSF